MAWDKTLIPEGVLAPDLNDQIRANWDALEADINREHQFSTGGTAANQIIHRQGSARCYWQATAPATRISGDAFTSDDLGSLWIDSDNNKIYLLTATTPTWTSVESVSIATLLAASRTFAEAITFAKAAILSKAPTLTEGIVANNSYLQGRNAANDGNVDLIKADGSDVPTLPTGSALADSTAPTADAKLPPKKYVDDQIQFYTNLGAWDATKAIDTEYTATTDGFVVCYGQASGAGSMQIQSPTGTVRTQWNLGSSQISGLCCPVKSGDTWKVVTSNLSSSAVYWLPLGA